MKLYFDGLSLGLCWCSDEEWVDDAVEPASATDDLWWGLECEYDPAVLWLVDISPPSSLSLTVKKYNSRIYSNIKAS